MKLENLNNPFFIKWMLCAILINLSSSIMAQVIPSYQFKKTLEEQQISFQTPPESQYETLALKDNDLQAADLTIETKDGQLEIRYCFEKIKNDATDQVPHIVHFQKAIHIASNDLEDASVKILPIDLEEISKNYNADSGMIFQFTPKKDFSKRKHCTLVTLFKEGRGHIFIFYLYDQPDSYLPQEIPFMFK